ncbi:unnamed protein product [Amoebophrya sp. A120]|nr:unnamed protein product [Amoebophrya sp. A120]|eukprot:GSA120T00009723001.1
MSCAVTSLVWIPKGRSKKRPERWEATDAELKALEEQYGIEGDIEVPEGAGADGEDDIDMDLDSTLAEEDGDEESSPDEEEAPAENNGDVKKAAASAKVKDEKKTGNIKTSSSKNDSKNDEDEMIDYSSDEDAEGNPKRTNLPMNAFTTNNITDHEAALSDPLLTAEQQESESEDEEDNIIKPTDNCFVACSCEDDECTLEVFVYDEEEGAMYVHHDLTLNAYPLCVDTVTNFSNKNGNYGLQDRVYTNLAAVGQFDNNIDIWDLDVLEPMAPVLTLGGSATSSGVTGKKSKKNKKTSADAGSLGGHTGAVMCLNTHMTERNLLCSGGADNCVKIWDLEKAACVHTFKHHEDKVQCAKWHPTEQSVLLTAGYDKKLCLLDVRKSEKHAVKMQLSADAEQACWNNENENICYVTTEDGKVYCYDARMIVKDGDNCSPMWVLDAFQKGACSALAQRNNVLLVGGIEGTAKVYDLRDIEQNAGHTTHQEVFSKQMNVGPIFASAGPVSKDNSDSMFLLSGHTVALWDLASEQKLVERFGFK